MADKAKSRLSVRIPPQTKEALSEVSESLGESQTSTVVRALETYFQRVRGLQEECTHKIEPLEGAEVGGYICADCHKIFDAAE